MAGRFIHPDMHRSMGEERLPIPAGWPGMVWAYRPNPIVYPRHHHLELEANLILRGSATYLVGDQRLDLERGDLLWLEPGTEHVLAERSPDFAMWIVVWQTAPRWPAGADGIPAGQACRRIEPASARLLTQTCAWLSNHADPAVAASALPWLYTMCWTAFQAAEQRKASGLHPAVATALRLLDDQDGNIPFARIAHQAGLSGDRLSRLFHAQVGTTMVQWRTRRRLERVASLIAGGTSLANAAARAGFGSYTQFHRSFRSAYGVSPRDHLTAGDDDHGD